MNEQVTTKPKGVITETEAKDLDANWTNTRQKAVDAAAGKPDNRSSWWSLEDMRNYLDYAETQAKDLGYAMSGVRVYLGVYGKDAPEDKANYTTMFIAPTGEPLVKNETKAAAKNEDIPGGDSLNSGPMGVPPEANYPQ